MEEDVVEKIKTVMEKEVNPMLAMEGGGVDLVDFKAEEGRVEVRLTGACSGCPYGKMTLYGLVEERLKASVPEVKEVVAI